MVNDINNVRGLPVT